MRLLCSLALIGCLFASCKSVHQNEGISSIQAVAESAASDPHLGIGMNDMSILLPRNSEKNFDSKLPVLSALNDGEVFIPKDAAGLIQKNLNGVFFDKKMFDFFRPTALRFVPCANKLQVKEKIELCVATMQVIWQLRSSEEVKAGIGSDRSIHTIYLLKKEEMQSVVDNLKKLHSAADLDTELLPLQVHPVIAKQGSSGAYFQGVMALFRQYAKVSRMIGYASLQSRPGLEWDMQQFVIKDQQSIAEPFPGSDASILQVITFPGRGDSLSFGSTVEPQIEPHPIFLGAPDEEEIKKVRESRLASAALINNPTLHNIRNMNCAGCHLAHHAFIDTPRKGYIEPSTAYSSKHWDLSVTTPTTPRAISFESLQMFSYSLGGDGPAKITRRVINETAEALEDLVKIGYIKAPVDWDRFERKFPVVKRKTVFADVDGEIVSFTGGRCLVVSSDSKGNDVPAMGPCDGDKSSFSLITRFGSKLPDLTSNFSDTLTLGKPTKNGIAVDFNDGGSTGDALKSVLFVAGKGDYWLIKIGKDLKCLGIIAGKKGDGALLEASDCVENDSQKWYWEPL